MSGPITKLKDERAQSKRRVTQKKSKCSSEETHLMIFKERLNMAGAAQTHYS